MILLTERTILVFTLLPYVLLPIMQHAGSWCFPEIVQLRDSSICTTLTVGSFSTNFTFAIASRNYYYNANGWLHGDGFGFIFSPDNSTEGSAGGALCMIDSRTDGFASNHLFAVKFDTFQNVEYNDSSNNHVGVDVPSMTSRASYIFVAGSLLIVLISSTTGTSLPGSSTTARCRHLECISPMEQP